MPWTSPEGMLYDRYQLGKATRDTTQCNALNKKIHKD